MTHQVNLPNLSLILAQLPISEYGNDFLQAARLHICRYIICQMTGSMGLLPLAVGKHEGLIILGALHQVQCVLMLFFCLAAEACGITQMQVSMGLQAHLSVPA